MSTLVMTQETPAAERTQAQTQPQVQPGARWTRMLAFLARQIDGLKRELKIRRVTEAVKAFDDRILKDLGITRGEIDYVVRYGPANDDRAAPPPLPDGATFAANAKTGTGSRGLLDHCPPRRDYLSGMNVA